MKGISYPDLFVGSVSPAFRLCYNCKQPGHESNACPQPRTSGTVTSRVQGAHGIRSKAMLPLPRNWTRAVGLSLSTPSPAGTKFSIPYFNRLAPNVRCWSWWLSWHPAASGIRCAEHGPRLFSGRRRWQSSNLLQMRWTEPFRARLSCKKCKMLCLWKI